MFTLKIDTANAAFKSPRKEYEVACILREVARALEHGETVVTLRDINGNTVGKATLS